ncbi:MAG: ribosomal L7Ae/L30e/S12e/Gadd45 family protein [Lachnospiraceae bacterium]|nr:ribosomal L7Ae/L30e/S12e/Gadd45 family protein [Lachnospiraceae bacterium]
MAMDPVLSMIGLSAKAGKVKSGEFAVEQAVKGGKAYMVIVAEDASENSKKAYQNMCDFYEVPIFFYGDKETLGTSCGKEFRASVAIMDENLAKAVADKLSASGR